MVRRPGGLERSLHASGVAPRAKLAPLKQLRAVSLTKLATTARAHRGHLPISPRKSQQTDRRGWLRKLFLGVSLEPRHKVRDALFDRGAGFEVVFPFEGSHVGAG